jgi:hypothetical protein
MHGTTRGRTATKTVSRANAVVWLGHGRALVLRDGGPDGLDEAEVVLPDFPAATPVALAEIAHRIGAVDRVLVLGTEDLRTALEREIVAIGHAPDTIREAAIEGPVDRDVLIAKLRRLA